MAWLPWGVTALSAVYFALLPALFMAINTGLPMWLERSLLVVGAPGILLMTLWTPLLRKIGLSQGEWIVGPSPIAYALLALLHTLLIYAAAALLSKFLAR
jgi:hypothetical protein